MTRAFVLSSLILETLTRCRLRAAMTRAAHPAWPRWYAWIRADGFECLLAVLKTSTILMGLLLVPMTLTMRVGPDMAPPATPVLCWDLPWSLLLWVIPMGILGGGIALRGSFLVLVVLPLGAVFEVIVPWRAAQRAERHREIAWWQRVIESTPPNGAPGRSRGGKSSPLIGAGMGRAARGVAMGPGTGLAAGAALETVGAGQAGWARPQWDDHASTAWMSASAPQVPGAPVRCRPRGTDRPREEQALTCPRS